MATKVLNGLDLSGQKVENVASPSSANDAVNKSYVDNLLAGLVWKPAVRVATTANGTLESAYEDGDTIDGVTLATGDRILIKNQSTGAENGIYVVAASGAPTRATDADGAGELVPNATVFVSEGTTNADTAWTCTTNGAITVGSTATTWAQFGGGGASYTAGDGLDLSGNEFSVDVGTGLALSGGEVVIDSSVVVRKYAVLIGNGSSTSITVTHNLGTRDVQTVIYDANTYEVVLADVENSTTNTVTVDFATAPSSNAYRAVVFG